MPALIREARKIASKSLKNFGLAVLTGSKKKILEIINAIAPEHLELCTNFDKEILRDVKKKCFVDFFPSIADI